MCFHALIGPLRMKKKHTIGPNNAFDAWLMHGLGHWGWRWVVSCDAVEPGCDFIRIWTLQKITLLCKHITIVWCGLSQPIHHDFGAQTMFECRLCPQLSSSSIYFISLPQTAYLHPQQPQKLCKTCHIVQAHGMLFHCLLLILLIFSSSFLVPFMKPTLYNLPSPLAAKTVHQNTLFGPHDMFFFLDFFTQFCFVFDFLLVFFSSFCLFSWHPPHTIYFHPSWPKQQIKTHCLGSMVCFFPLLFCSFSLFLTFC